MPYGNLQGGRHQSLRKSQGAKLERLATPVLAREAEGFSEEAGFDESAVEAGMLSASSTMALVATKPAYQNDLAAARAELTALRASAPAPQNCAAEHALVAQRVMPSLDKTKPAH